MTAFTASGHWMLHRCGMLYMGKSLVYYLDGLVSACHIWVSISLSICAFIN